MRRLYRTVPLFSILPLLLSGCHQAPATTAAAPLAPVGAGQAPVLTPFGGPTKVTPPPTGSYATPNAYMGNTAPAGNIAPGVAPPTYPPSTYPPQSNNTSGGWTGSGTTALAPSSASGFSAMGPSATGTGIAPNSPSGVAPVSTFGVTSATDPRAGGMQVIDLTGAPPPPGYQGPHAATSISVPPPQAPPGGWGPPIPTTPTQSYPTPTYPAGGSPVQGYPNTNPQNVASPYPSNASAEIASRLTPLPPSDNALSIQPPTVQSVGVQPPGSIPGPTTEPVTPPASGSQDLMWRSPGTRF